MGAGWALHVAAHVTITKAFQEYLVLEGLQVVAFGMLPVKKMFEDIVIPGLVKHGDFVAASKMVVGAAIGKTLDDSIEGRVSP